MLLASSSLVNIRRPLRPKWTSGRILHRPQGKYFIVRVYYHSDFSPPSAFDPGADLNQDEKNYILVWLNGFLPVRSAV